MAADPDRAGRTSAGRAGIPAGPGGIPPGSWGSLQVREGVPVGRRILSFFVMLLSVFDDLEYVKLYVMY